MHALRAPEVQWKARDARAGDAEANVRRPRSRGRGGAGRSPAAKDWGRDPATPEWHTVKETLSAPGAAGDG